MVGGSMRTSCGLGIRKPGNRRPHSQGIRSCGSYHKVDPSEHVFRTCASQALREALKKLGTQVLEPIMQVELTVPADFLQGSLGRVIWLLPQFCAVSPAAGGPSTRALPITSACRSPWYLASPNASPCTPDSR